MPSSNYTIGVGNYGAWKGQIDQTSQSQTGNYSMVRVRAWMINNGQSTSWSSASKSISGTNSWSGSDSFSIGAGSSLLFIDQTFTVSHGSDGNKTVSYSITLGSTGTSTFGSGGTVSLSMQLTRIPKRPSKPGTPSFSNKLPTSLTVSWSASSDNGGKSISGYLLRYWKNTSASGSYTNVSQENNRSRSVTGLTPGQYYTFAVYAYNGSGDNGGYSNQSSTATLRMLAGAWIKISGTWKLAIPYVRVSGVWKMALPYVKQSGTWTMTS